MVRWGGREPTVLADGFSFLEGPRWHDGRLYVSDFYRHGVYAVTDTGGVEQLCTVDRQPSGLGFTPDGDLLIVSMLDQRVLRLRDGELTEHADLSGHAAGPCNDMLVDAAGRAYVGCFGAFAGGRPQPTRLLVVEPDGRAGVAADGLEFPNGTVLGPDGRELLIAETFAHRITRFAVGADGTLSGRRVWADFGPAGTPVSTSVSEPGAPMLPDGMTLDAEGAVWVADARGGGILRVAEGGRILDAVPTTGRSVFAAALGGADGRTLYLCAAAPLGTERPGEHRHAALLSCRVEVPGAGLP